MRIKSYFAESVQEAMDRARIELGAEATLISSTRTGDELKNLGAYEVVFGFPKVYAKSPVAHAEERSTPPGGGSALMLVGPPGAGKTVTLMKLAFRYGLRARQRVQLLSLDSDRLGAWEQLGTFARISGIDFRPVHKPGLLAAGISQSGVSSSLILIDTPGFARAEEDAAEELARITRELPIEVHLVLPAYSSLPAAQQAWNRFARFQPARLLLTHVDAIEGSAPLFELTMRSGLPLSFLANGQQISEDLHEANRLELTDQLRRARGRTVSMAA